MQVSQVLEEGHALLTAAQMALPASPTREARASRGPYVLALASRASGSQRLRRRRSPQEFNIGCDGRTNMSTYVLTRREWFRRLSLAGASGVTGLIAFPWLR